MTDPRDDFLRVRPYLGDYAEALLACEEGQAKEGLRIDVPLLAAVCLRETWAGWAPGYRPRGEPNGEGDFRGGIYHGRGLFQIDIFGPFKDLIPAKGQPWPPGEQARAAILVLQTARLELAEYRGRPVFEQACLCRYNARLDRVKWALESNLNPDLVTTGRNYGSDVQRRRDELLEVHPEAFRLSVGGVA